MKMENDLPIEVLHEILSYLGVHQRLNMSLVCKRWLRACNMDDINFVVPNNIDCCSQIKRKYSCVTIKDASITERHVNFLNSLGEHLRHLELHGSKLFWTNIHCPDLHTLKIGDDENVLMSFSTPLLQLERLNLMSATISDKTLDALSEMAPHLKELALPPRIEFHPRIIKRFYPSPLSPPSDCILTQMAVEKFIEQRSKTMTAIFLPQSITDEALQRLSRLKSLRLREIQFCDPGSYLRLPKDECIMDFFKHQTFITAIGFHSVTDNCVETICSSLPNLREFTAENSYFLSNAIVNVFSLPCLRKLKIANCYHTTKDIITKAVSSMTTPDLCVLHLRNVKGFCESHFLEIFRRTPRLDELFLSQDYSVNFEMVLAVLPRKLRRLALFGLTGTDLRELRHLDGLVELDLGFCHNLKQDGLLEGIRSKHLTALHLGYTDIPPDALQKIKTNNPGLLVKSGFNS